MPITPHEEDLDGRQVRGLARRHRARTQPYPALRHRRLRGNRAYKTPNGVAIFRLKDHMERLLRSCKILRSTCPTVSRNSAKQLRRPCASMNCTRVLSASPGLSRFTAEMASNPIGSPVNTRDRCVAVGPYLGDDAG